MLAPTISAEITPTAEPARPPELAVFGAARPDPMPPAGDPPRLRVYADGPDEEAPEPHPCPEVLPVAFDQIAGREWLSWSNRRVAGPHLLQLLLFSPAEWEALDAEDRPVDARALPTGGYCALRYARCSAHN